MKTTINITTIEEKINRNKGALVNFRKDILKSIEWVISEEIENVEFIYISANSSNTFSLLMELVNRYGFNKFEMDNQGYIKVGNE